ncbi:RteC domain-containing protein [Mucilaginibacter sp. FT3.2]|uniref:RteC domain-containing protein n=1 Tax=Mucilaginibacter sp. FT3.2 TaxID=2723090 RepID=UPI001618D200|nr:RteC domain-containing protein [Mucilaginibacter sp. FT3.2]MBB6234925.1 hypothetical protein [Mucilaginibacter sp. FT3.2]
MDVTISEYVRKSYDKLEEDFFDIRNSGLKIQEQIKRLSEVAGVAVNDFRGTFLHYDFVDKEEEIQFFKYAKPEFYALVIFFDEQLNLELHKPVAQLDTIRCYYEKELEVSSRFAGRHRFLYEYYRDGMTELDYIYFTKIVGSQSSVLTGISYNDPGFSTPADYAFARFIAEEKFQVYILKKIISLTDSNVSGQYVKDSVGELRWTGEIINLVELIYGIYHTGQLNNGTASLAQIVRWFEGSLGVKIGRPHRHFIDISRRKRLSITKFIDHMRDVIIQKIHDSFNN